MKIRLPILCIAIVAFGLVGCGQRSEKTNGMATPSPDVSAYVAQTLTAIVSGASEVVTPTATHSPEPPTATTEPTGTPTAAPSETPTAQPTQAATAIASLTPTATPTETASSAPTATPTGTVPSSTPAVDQTNCIDKAGFYGDVTIPDNTLLQKNEAFVKTWRFKNVGTCTWGDGYELVFADGHIMGGPPSSPLPHAAPGDIIDVSVNLKAPADGGTYAADWQFQNAQGVRFGVNSHGEDFFWVIIKVDWGPGVGPTPTPPPVNCAYQTNPDYEAQLLTLINNARAANGVSPLTLQNQLSTAALGHSADMACNNYLDHNGSDGSTHSSRLKAVGYQYAYESENIYAGGTAQDAFDWWMNSPVHRDNILSSKVTQIGIGYAFYAQSNFGGYYTLDFGHP